ncbi:hypothetical protein [Streptomyces sp. NPDC048473]|uniref:hypothetical protein n=1 Tax=unclassified Streptomyces TaxID=2593676 RepID=UPI0037209518
MRVVELDLPQLQLPLQGVRGLTQVASRERLAEVLGRRGAKSCAGLAATPAGADK